MNYKFASLKYYCSARINFNTLSEVYLLVCSVIYSFSHIKFVLLYFLIINTLESILYSFCFDLVHYGFLSKAILS